MGKAGSASSKSRDCMPVWGVYAGGNHLRKYKHK